MPVRPLIIDDKFGYIRDITNNAVSKLPPVRPSADAGLEHGCGDCVPLMFLCDRCTIASKLYDIDAVVLFAYTELSECYRLQYVDYILQKLEQVDEPTFVDDLIEQLGPFVQFVNLYRGDVYRNGLTYDILIISYMSGCYDYVKNKYTDAFIRYNIDICRDWYTSIFDVSNMYGLLSTILVMVRLYSIRDYQQIVDAEFEIYELTLHFMAESAGDTPNITLELPKCFTIRMLTHHAVEYGFGKEGTRVCLFINGSEEMLNNDIEIGELETKDLFCLYDAVPE